MTTPRAALLPTSTDLLGEISFRRGERAGNPRRGETRQVFFFFIDGGFAVLREKLVRFLQEPPFTTDASTLLEEDIYIKASKNAAQVAYRVFDRAAFETLLRERWSHITQADVDRLASGETDPARVGRLVAARFSFQFFMYVSIAGTTPRPALRRATTSRIVGSTQAVAEFARTQALGPITTNHLIVTHARQPEGMPVQLPADNTTRQARALDDLIAAAEAPRTGDDDAATIEVEVGGVWVRLRVRLSTLRLALGLPAHDMFSRGIFHGFTPVAPSATNADLEDEDHQQDDEEMAV